MGYGFLGLGIGSTKGGVAMGKGVRESLGVGCSIYGKDSDMCGFLSSSYNSGGVLGTCSLALSSGSNGFVPTRL